MVFITNRCWTMTIDKERYIKIPIWLVSVLLPLLISAIISIAAYSANNAKSVEKIETLEKNQANKVERTEFEMLQKNFDVLQHQLEIIDSKIDKLR